MYIDIGKKCPSNALVCVPHKEEPMTVKELSKEFPDFVKIFDGEAKENTMLFYWKWNKQEKVFEFIDSDAEDEVAELMNVNLLVASDTEETVETRQLSTDEIDTFKEQLYEIQQLLKDSGFKK